MTRRLIIIGTLALLAATGCLGRSAAPTYYTLTQTSERVGLDYDSTLAIGVGPTTFPTYLDRPQIVTRRDSQIVFKEFRRWAGSLDSEFLQALGMSLSRDLQTDRVAIYPAQAPFTLDARVLLQVDRFDGTLGEAVWLEARWVIISGADGTLLKSGHASLREPLGSDHYRDLIQAHRSVITRLSKQVAEAFRSLDFKPEEKPTK